MLQHRHVQEFCLGSQALKEALISRNASLKDLYVSRYSHAERRFLSEAYNPNRMLFESLLIRTAFDWLVSRPEEPQDFESFYNSTRWRQCDPYRKKIYLQPIDVDEPRQEAGISFMDDVKSYLEAFFLGFRVRSLPSISTSSMKCHFRQQERSCKVQLHTDAILRHLQRIKPTDAFCILGLTFIDLYPCDTWNYTFGKSANELAVGVCSFSRLSLGLSGEGSGMTEQGVAAGTGDSCDKRAWPVQPRTVIPNELLQCCKVVSHEACHLVGLQNCRWLRCVMQGVTSPDEALLRPMDLCPICLRKLHSALGFSLLQRYKELQSWCRRVAITATHRERASRVSSEEDHHLFNSDSGVACERLSRPVPVTLELSSPEESVSQGRRQNGGSGTSTSLPPTASTRIQQEGPAAAFRAELSTREEGPAAASRAELSTREEGPAAVIRAELSTREEGPAAAFRAELSTREEGPAAASRAELSTREEGPAAAIRAELSTREEGPAAASRAELSTRRGQHQGGALQEGPAAAIRAELCTREEGPAAASRAELSTREEGPAAASRAELCTDLLGHHEAWLDSCIRALQGEVPEDELSQLDHLVDAMPSPRANPPEPSVRVSLELPREERGLMSVIGQKFSQLRRKLRSKQRRTDHSLDDSKD
ncbi:hypothetical protein AAFF_G00276230 [Aldrovandia affinis]|uniref:Archaemetzincin-1 n=1 Tax=Aldrovandia affinis TaxID=143900 RepID=A0AAD7RAS1_9TELE|nr:hypothetical protein AAFF_G00276230 [Aldrovandia affinis]